MDGCSITAPICMAVHGVFGVGGRAVVLIPAVMPGGLSSAAIDGLICKTKATSCVAVRGVFGVGGRAVMLIPAVMPGFRRHAGCACSMLVDCWCRMYGVTSQLHACLACRATSPGAAVLAAVCAYWH
jgi:hypothetical protein